MNKIREFGVLKWLVFPSMSLALAGIVAWFNVTIFGWRDGAFYIAAVVIIALFSIAINKYVGAENSRLAVAAFIFEILLILVLGANAVYSLSIQREMAVARQAEQSSVEALREIGRLKGSRTQREALKKVDKQKSSQSVFAENERVLLWVMAGELLAYVVAAFTLLALSHLAGEKTGRTTRPVSDPFPAELDVEKRALTRRGELQKETTHVSLKRDDTDSQRKTTRDDLRRLRDCLKLIAFHHGPCHFKVDVKDDYLWIRQLKSEHGEARQVAATKAALSILDDVTRMEPDDFRLRLEAWLRRRGFEI